MINERTLILLKPDAVQRGLIGEIITRFEKVGLKPVAMKLVWPTEDLAASHYDNPEEWLEMIGQKAKAGYAKRGVELKEEDKEIGIRIQNSLRTYLSQGPVMAVVWQGPSACALGRKLTGATDPLGSAPGTIRGDFALDSFQLADSSNRPLYNLLHASDDDPAVAEAEIKKWFTAEELHEYKKIDDEILFDIWD